jgi:hypothetical protein
VSARKATVLLLLFIVALSGIVFHLKLRDELVDFEVGFAAAQRLKLGETLYRASDGHYQFKYLPVSAFFYLPLTLLPLAAAKALWFGTSLLASGLIFALSASLIRLEGSSLRVSVILTALISGRYFLRELELGQINALVTLVLMLMIWQLTQDDRLVQRKAFVPGLCGGLATAIKPYAVVFFAYLGLKKKWPSLTAGLILIGLALLAPSLFYGWRGNFEVLREWYFSLSASTPTLFSSQDNVSLIGLLTKWTRMDGVSRSLYLCSLTGLGGFFVYLVQRGRTVVRSTVLEGFLLLALIPLISPLGWDYTFLASAPAIMLILANFDKFRPVSKVFLCLNFAVIALSLHDVLGRSLYARFMSWSIITINFLILLGYLAFLRVRGHA